MITPESQESVKTLKMLYDKGINITQYLREKYGKSNSPIRSFPSSPIPSP
jgi:hypothetical protein